MNLVRCDRCKKEVKGYNSETLLIKEKRRVLFKFKNFEVTHDLCDDCVKEFGKWLDNKKEEVVTYDTIRKEIKELDQAIQLEWDKCKDAGVTVTFNMLGYAKNKLEELIGEEE